MTLAIGRWLLIGLELLFGWWLVLGFQPRLTRWAAVVCFTVFLAASLSQALLSQANCGCFGKVVVPPWLTAGLDAALAILFTALRPDIPSPTPVRFASLRRTLFTLACFLVTGSVLFGIALRADFGIAGEQGTVMTLEEAAPIGRPCLLLDHTAVGDELRQGHWIVLLYRPGCPACQQALQRCEEWSNSSVAERRERRVAVIAVPPWTADAASPRGSFLRIIHGQLNESPYWWSVPTPTFLLLANGVVTGVHSSAEVVKGGPSSVLASKN